MVFLDPNYSVALGNVVDPTILSQPSLNSILTNELSWHYSTHLLAELKGEEVIEDLLTLCRHSGQRSLLTSQLKDEKKHVTLFRKAVDQTGFDGKANLYAEGYCALVKKQSTLSEKVYVFQILTEAVSAAYCAWRLTAVNSTSPAPLISCDKEVYEDETKHLLMGNAVLKLCDKHELAHFLSVEKRKALLREMNTICQAVSGSLMLDVVLHNSVSRKNFKVKCQLDSSVSRSLLKEVRHTALLIDSLIPALKNEAV